MERRAQTIVADLPFGQPPKWALLERQLIDLMNAAIDPLLEKYVYSDGTIMWPTKEDHVGVDALDDAYESFHNWPLFYLLGGADRFLDLSHKEFDAITEQFTRYDSGHGHPMVVKEYEQGYDWFHQGEGYLFFYLLCLADPSNERNMDRAKRFAGFYMNEDPDAPNYDEKHNILRSAHTGSKGPGHRNFSGEPWHYEDWKKWYGLPFLDVPGVETVDDLKDHDKAALMGTAMKERQAYGDVAVNLAVTTMLANAYLLTGEEKYKAWIRTYVDGWVERTAQNGGILPDNVGLSGIVGEHNGGKWYGGYYGWTWPHGWETVGDAAVIAGQNAMLLFQDASYLDLPRSQIDHLIKLGVRDNGTLYVPHKKGDPFEKPPYNCEPALKNEQGEIYRHDGWFEYLPMDSRYIAHLWNMSRDEADLARLVTIRNSKTREWEQVNMLRKKDQGGHEQAWISYLQGDYPAYPEEILMHNLEQVYGRLQFMRDDTQDPSTYGDWYLQARNPVTAEGLTQLTLGAPQPDYNGGLLMASIRYADLERGRPGLPADVGALVEHMDAEGLTVKLVNLSVSQKRELAIYAGAFGEHQFTTAAYRTRSTDGDGMEEAVIEDNVLEVTLLPGSEITLHLGMKRFAHDPAYTVGSR
ncbi:hypothetical protein [Paenibacillus sp. OV219]|uniref:hypothetical protein n=1 Tax=Paenibacillus sp. OV219 TaxID=1884377 RepID=UPI0008D0F111|nr:hypothetical protein [Paenibacillus sp. OV219]SEN80353.1 hypothetical protein SAMN05518847_104180 [Paenibacillus sp. OV219]